MADASEKKSIVPTGAGAAANAGGAVAATTAAAAAQPAPPTIEALEEDDEFDEFKEESEIFGRKEGCETCKTSAMEDIIKESRRLLTPIFSPPLPTPQIGQLMK